MVLIPLLSAAALASPWRVTRGAPLSSGGISISRIATPAPFEVTPRDLNTASFPAHRGASGDRGEWLSLTVRYLGFGENPLNERRVVGGDSRDELLVDSNTGNRTTIGEEVGDRLDLVEGELLFSHELRKGVLVSSSAQGGLGQSSITPCPRCRGYKEDRL